MFEFGPMKISLKAPQGLSLVSHMICLTGFSPFFNPADSEDQILPGYQLLRGNGPAAGWVSIKA